MTIKFCVAQSSGDPSTYWWGYDVVISNDAKYKVECGDLKIRNGPAEDSPLLMHARSYSEVEDGVPRLGGVGTYVVVDSSAINDELSFTLETKSTDPNSAPAVRTKTMDKPSVSCPEPSTEAPSTEAPSTEAPSTEAPSTD